MQENDQSETSKKPVKRLVFINYREKFENAQLEIQSLRTELEALKNENNQLKKSHLEIQSFNFLFELCKYKNFREYILSFLGARDLQNLGKATRVKYPLYQRSCDTLFYSSKEHYLLRKLAQDEQAETLRDLVLAWEYEEVKALVTRHLKVLSIVCDYKMNRWQDDSKKRRLSALEYAWLAGDENFIELFERLAKDRLDPICYQNKEALQAESSKMLGNLAQALSAYGANKMQSEAVVPLWRAAPHWVYGLAYFLYYNDIQSLEQAACVDILSDKFRAVAPSRLAYTPPLAPLRSPTRGHRCGAAIKLPLGPLCSCLSVRITHPHKEPSRQRQSLIEQWSNMGFEPSLSKKMSNKSNK